MPSQQSNVSPYGKAFYEVQYARNAHAARSILKLLFSALPVSTAVDFGCGVGTWLSVAKEEGVDTVLGMDGAWVDSSMLKINSAEFNACDLAEPAKLNQRYDLAISLEVAEHLPPARAKSFVSDLCAAADLVLFSAAVPGQGGVNHINEQWQSYWSTLFLENGYQSIDCVRPRIWQDPAINCWYKQNIFLYVCANRYDEAKGKLESAPTASSDMVDLVHPDLFLTKSENLLVQSEKLENFWFLFCKTCEVFYRKIIRKIRSR